jgi:hypothetical protein
MTVSQRELEKAIIKSQHCQRNWDLEATIPDEHIQVLKTAVTQCPSKQNVAYYRAKFITNREVIEAVHSKTDGFTLKYGGESTTNPQVLANLLVVFEELDMEEVVEGSEIRNEQFRELKEGDGDAELASQLLVRDKNMAIGIAAGYLNLTASLLGYSTGCCACFDGGGIRDILGLKKEPALLMGIGIKNPNLGRRVHQKFSDIVFPTKRKQKIEVDFIP